MNNSSINAGSSYKSLYQYVTLCYNMVSILLAAFTRYRNNLRSSCQTSVAASIIIYGKIKMTLYPEKSEKCSKKQMKYSILLDHFFRVLICLITVIAIISCKNSNLTGKDYEEVENQSNQPEVSDSVLSSIEKYHTILNILEASLRECLYNMDELMAETLLDYVLKDRSVMSIILINEHNKLYYGRQKNLDGDIEEIFHIDDVTYDYPYIRESIVRNGLHLGEIILSYEIVPPPQPITSKNSDHLGKILYKQVINIGNSLERGFFQIDKRLQRSTSWIGTDIKEVDTKLGKVDKNLEEVKKQLDQIDENLNPLVQQIKFAIYGLIAVIIISTLLIIALMYHWFLKKNKQAHSHIENAP